MVSMTEIEGGREFGGGRKGVGIHADDREAVEGMR